MIATSKSFLNNIGYKMDRKIVEYKILQGDQSILEKDIPRFVNRWRYVIWKTRIWI